MKQWYHFEKNKTNFNGDPTVLPQKKLKFAKQSKLFKYVARITKLISVYFVEFNIYFNYIQLYLYSIQLSHNFIMFSFSNFGLKKKNILFATFSQKFENSKRNWNYKMCTTKSCFWKWQPSNVVLNKELVYPVFTTQVRGKNRPHQTKKYKHLRNQMHQVPETKFCHVP